MTVVVAVCKGDACPILSCHILPVLSRRCLPCRLRVLCTAEVLWLRNVLGNPINFERPLDNGFTPFGIMT